MTEYVIKEIGHQCIVYADRLSIGACADENEALQLVIEDSAAKARTPNPADHKSQNRVGCWQAALNAASRFAGHGSLLDLVE